MPASAIREQVAVIRQTTNQPFNLNFFIHASPASAPDTVGRVRLQLALYFTEFGLGPVPEPREPFPSLTRSGSACFGAPAACRQLSLQPSFRYGYPTDRGSGLRHLELGDHRRRGPLA
jgi:hypothetical protein